MKKPLVAASALAMGFGLSGVAFAGDHHDTPSVSAAIAASVQAGDSRGNSTELGAFDLDVGSSWSPQNKVDSHAFDNAQGLFNVQQNAGQNSLQQADNTLGAILNCSCGSGLSGALALSAQVADIGRNETEMHGAFVNIDASNRITDHAFDHATGLFNVSQNTGSNSMQQASNTVAAIVGGGH